MYFPEGAYLMDSHKPYAEMIVGVRNIMKFFHVEYVRRLNYTELPDSPHWGIRYGFSLSF